MYRHEPTDVVNGNPKQLSDLTIGRPSHLGELSDNCWIQRYVHERKVRGRQMRLLYICETANGFSNTHALRDRQVRL